MAPETNLITIEKPAVPAIGARLAPMVQEARMFAVCDVDTHRMALERVKALRTGEKEITDLFEDARKKADAAKKSILTTRDGLVGPLAEARSAYDRHAQEFEAVERRKAEDEQRRLQQQARKQEEERQIQAAIAAEQDGNQQEAEAILDEPVSVPAIMVVPQVAKVEGVFTTTRWSAEVFDFLALVRYVAEHPKWISLLEPNGPNLNRLAISQHESLTIPGVRAVATQSRGSR